MNNCAIKPFIPNKPVFTGTKHITETTTPTEDIKMLNNVQEELEDISTESYKGMYYGLKTFKTRKDYENGTGRICIYRSGEDPLLSMDVKNNGEKITKITYKQSLSSEYSPSAGNTRKETHILKEKDLENPEVAVEAAKTFKDLCNTKVYDEDIVIKDEPVQHSPF